MIKRLFNFTEFALNFRFGLAALRLATIIVLDTAIFRLNYIQPRFGLDKLAAIGGFYQLLLLLPFA